MKKRITIFIVAAAFILFQSTSPWEGAATTAPAGELPETGFFVATNSFPRNTVVDITNIETDKSTRVIVANTLNSPGLLAIISREAAELIGMKEGSVIRVRMVQPSDPIAYLRFSQGFNYDSGNVINEENLLDEHYSDDSYRPSEQPQEPAPPAVADAGRPGYLLEPEWGGRGQSIIDLPGYQVRPYEPAEQPPPAQPEEPPYYITEWNQRPQPPVEEPPYYTPPPYETETYPPFVAEPLREEIIKDVSKKIEEAPPREIVKDVGVYIAEPSVDDFEKDAPSFIAEQKRDEIIKEVPEYFAETQRNEIIKDVPERTGYLAVEPPKVTEEPQELVIVPSQERRPDQGIYGIDPSVIIPGITTPAPSTPARPAPVTETTFSVREINELKPGWYYVQVAAVVSPDAAENTARRIDQRYDPGIFRDTDDRYRVLLGPLNQGESAAMLQRVKSVGFKDAFVRHAR